MLPIGGHSTASDTAAVSNASCRVLFFCVVVYDFGETPKADYQQKKIENIEPRDGIICHRAALSQRARSQHASVSPIFTVFDDFWRCQHLEQNPVNFRIRWCFAQTRTTRYSYLIAARKQIPVVQQVGGCEIDLVRGEVAEQPEEKLVSRYLCRVPAFERLACC